jgi:hypothetical protein
MAVQSSAFREPAVQRPAVQRAVRGDHAALQEVVRRTRPVSGADEQVLPVPTPLGSMLPWAGLRRGATVALAGPGATSLALALLAAASAAGSWAAVVGMPSLGVTAAAQAGIELARLALVAAPGTDWPAVTAALLDAFDLVLLQPPGRSPPRDARRLAARARERGAVLLVRGPWEGAEVRLDVRDAAWSGLEAGHGHLRRRRVEVVADGRGAAARRRQARLWLPADDGRMEEERTWRANAPPAEWRANALSTERRANAPSVARRGSAPSGPSSSGAPTGRCGRQARHVTNRSS